jgi:prepilin-type N-terminal cleavage/methylation domain-containing protein
MKHRNPIRGGFTLIELLAVVIVTSIFIAIAVTIFLSATADAKNKQCRANLQNIANLEEQYRITNTNSSGVHVYTTTMSNLTSSGSIMPLCPSGGAYSVLLSDGTVTAQNGQAVPVGGLVISCNASGHGKYAPGIDTY